MSRRRDMQHDDRGAAEVVASIMIAPVVVGFTVLVFFLGRQTATDMLGDTSTCAGGPNVVVDLSDFRPGGIVTVDITCGTRNEDLTAAAAPSRTFTGHGAAVIDTYRAGTP